MDERPIILFGAGKVGRMALRFFGANKVAYFCDNAASLEGKNIMGKMVLSFAELVAMHEKYQVVISLRNIATIREVEGQLQCHNIPVTLFEQGERNFSGAQEAFSYVYEHGVWGSNTKNAYPFFSGKGSHDSNITAPYIALIQDIIRLNNVKRIVEIGCGDFAVMDQILQQNPMGHITYIGIDVVDDLVKFNNARFGNGNIQFVAMDASAENSHLPTGDLLIVRQVLQHLDNQSIASILKKIAPFPLVLVTEHIYSGPDAVYNVDKSINGDIRLYKKSGVYLEKEPYGYKNIIHLLGIEDAGGVIRTSLIVNHEECK